MVLRLGDQPYVTVEKTHRAVARWFRGREWVSYVRLRPTRESPRRVVVAVEPTSFFGRDYPAEAARIEAKFQPRFGGRDTVRVQWVERPADGEATWTDPVVPDDFTIAVGLHQETEEHHPEIEEAMHFQIERPEGEPARAGYVPSKDGPLGVVDDFVAHVPYLVSEIREELGGDRVDRE